MKISYKKQTLSLILILILGLTQGCNLPYRKSLMPTPTIEPLTVTPSLIASVKVAIPVTLPTKGEGLAADKDSSRTSSERSAGGGDRFSQGQYERLFNAGTMDTFYLHLDILQYEIHRDDLWVYASILLRSYNSDGTLSGQYALEIDNDVDGRGESD